MAYDFNGTTGKILGTGAALSGLPGTISAWARPDVTNSEREIAGLSRSSNTAPLFRIRITSTGKASAQYRGNTGADSAGVGTTTMSTSAYQHVLGTFETTGAAAIYYNGTLEATGGTASVSTTITLDQTEIGVLQRTSAAQFWDGAIAEVAMWSVVLDAAEIAALADGFSPLLIRPASLVFYAPLLRDQIDIKGRALTATGSPTVATHPRVYMPKRRGIIGVAAGGGTASGTLAGTTPSTTGSIAGNYGPRGTVAGTAPSTTGSFAGNVEAEGPLVGTTPSATASFAGQFSQPVDGTIAGTTPSATGNFAGSGGDVAATASVGGDDAYRPAHRDYAPGERRARGLAFDKEDPKAVRRALERAYQEAIGSPVEPEAEAADLVEAVRPFATAAYDTAAPPAGAIDWQAVAADAAAARVLLERIEITNRRRVAAAVLLLSV